MAISIPTRGVIFWPVGTGDSTTLVLDEEHFVQVDLHDLAMADEDDAIVSAVNDDLVEILPRRNGRPYLAAFILTHADKDHCLGFADLLEKVDIGELWATPRLWRELADDDVQLCDDALAFQDETVRRVDATIAAVDKGEEPVSGDRVRVVGYDTEQSAHAYSELPDEYLSYPGDAVSSVDGYDLSEVFEAFIHAPFKDDCTAERNTTSLALQIRLKGEEDDGHILFLGDLTHETIRKIFEYSEDHNRPERLEWDVLLAPHHCSKRALYERVDGKEVLQQDVVDALERHAADPCTVVISSCAFPETDTEGANPPHLLARDRYEEIADDVLVTAEFPDADTAVPIAFVLADSGLTLLDDEPTDDQEDKAAKAVLGAAAGFLAVAAAARAANRRRRGRNGLAASRRATADVRGQDAAPQQPVTFGA